jgi:uncharacterized protein (DUF58 family)
MPEYQIQRNRLQPYTKLEMLAKQVVEGFITGLHKSPFHGFSVEFAEHRLYNNGESTRHIDWKLYGKTDKMFVKRYEEETNLRCQIVIDNSSSMFFPVREKLDIDHPNKITFSVYAAACIMQLLRRQRDALGLSLFDEKVHLHTQAKSNSVHHKFLLGKLEELLSPIAPEEHCTSQVTDSLHFISENIHRRSLVVLFSDMFDVASDNAAMFDALQHLRYNKHEVILFHVVDKAKELDFDYENRPYRFIDMESGAEIKLQPAEVRKTYSEAIGNFHQELKLKCAQYKIDFIEADINKGFEQVLLPYLLKRERMG